MNKNRAHDHALLDESTLESRLAARIGVALTVANSRLPHDISERLRVAREHALVVARTSRKLSPEAASGGVNVDAGGSATMRGSPGQAGGSGFWQDWLMAALPAMLLIAGLLFISNLQQQELIDVAADIDAQLLADDLPPAAYSDPGFVQYLRKGPPQ